MCRIPGVTAPRCVVHYSIPLLGYTMPGHVVTLSSGSICGHVVFQQQLLELTS